MANAREDERFAHINKDPRFRPVPKHERKVKIDKRFVSMFHDKKFKLSYSVDKRGLPVQSSSSDNLKKFYNVSSESDDGSSGSDDDSPSVSSKNVSIKLEASTLKSKSKQTIPTKQVESETEESEADSLTEEKDLDLARGEGNVETSSDDSDEDIDDGIEENVYHGWGELDADAPKSDDISRRLAVCNMDWDRIKAQDLFVLFNSFKPAEGIIKSVKVYPSEYGLERMKEENEKGPAELTEEKLESDQEDYAETPEGSKYHMEKLRKYQLNRLRYYYGVVECDTSETSNQLYQELEGMEYESSAAQIDLRFVPDNMSFEHDPTSVCQSLPDMTTYKPVLFTTTALQQGKVDLTWDETNPERVERLEKAFEGGNEEYDLKAYLASSSEDEGVESDEERVVKQREVDNKMTEKKQISKYKALLADIEEQERKKEEEGFGLEIKWEPGLKTKTEELVKKQRNKKDLTPFEEFLEKKKDKKKNKKKNEKANSEDEEDQGSEKNSEDEAEAFSDDELPEDIDLNDPFFQNVLANSGKDKKKNKVKNRKRTGGADEGTKKSKAELELLLMGEDESKHFKLKDLVEESTLTKSKRKRLLRKRKHQPDKTKKGDDFEINVADPRFSALFSSALYNIDPSDPHYKKTKATEAFITEKQKRRHHEKEDKGELIGTSTSSMKEKLNPSLSLLINSVKNKTQNYRRQKC